MSQTLKDTISNWCAFVLVIAGALITLDQSGTVNFPSWVDNIMTVLATISGAIVAYLTGKPVK
jgi:hypothetical protein